MTGATAIRRVALSLKWHWREVHQPGTLRMTLGTGMIPATGE